MDFLPDKQIAGDSYPGAKRHMLRMSPELKFSVLQSKT